jgi:hypothetical protein
MDERLVKQKDAELSLGDRVLPDRRDIEKGTPQLEAIITYLKQIEQMLQAISLPDLEKMLLLLDKKGKKTLLANLPAGSIKDFL